MSVAMVDRRRKFEKRVIFLRSLVVWALQNVLQSIILIEILENSTIFQHFDTFIYSIKTLKFSRQFWLLFS